jgi:hypothetical protein
MLRRHTRPTPLRSGYHVVTVLPLNGNRRKAFIVSNWEGQNPRLEAAALADFV